MKLRTLLTTLLLTTAGAISAALNSGYYRIVSYNGKYLTENTSSNALICSDLMGDNYSQVWYLAVSGTDVTIKNALTDRYVKGEGSYSVQYYTATYSSTFTLGESDGTYTFQYGDYFHGGLHCDASLNVVQYDIYEDKSKWTVESATVDATALAAQKAATSEASATDLLKVFTSTACTELKSGYSESDLSALPATVQDMAAKIKDNTWATYSGWDKTEKTFRIADYKAYSSHTRWQSILGLGYSFARLTNPTGIAVKAGDYIQVYVGTIPSGQTVNLEVAGERQAVGSTYPLSQGMNVLLMASSGNCFVNYEVDNTTDGNAPFTSIDSYPAVTVHIEGGTVNGYFDLTKGDDNDDWANLQTHLMKGATVEMKTDYQLFHMNTSLVKAACPTYAVELLGEWSKILQMEYSLMGLEDYDGCWNNLLSAIDVDGDEYMYATNYGTYYNTSTISTVMNYAEMFAGGALWGPAHENGHIFQKFINMIGQTEVSNNLFSNVALFNNGHLTSRATNISTTFENMANNVFWNERGIWERTHLYFQLYQFFHILGNKTDFYPKLFKALRTDPMAHSGFTFTPATDDYLKFYKKCCEVSGYDLTEFFQAYGFFVIPTLSSYTLDEETKNAYMVNDYTTYYLTITQDEIDEAKAYVANQNLPKANIIFIEDRISAPDATYPGAAGAKKTAFSNEFPIGQAGETGQYTDFGATCSAYKYNVTNNKVTMEGTGAVGFKVYDSTGNLRGLYNTYSFTLPDGIGTGYTIKAAAGNGIDTAATFDATVGVIPSDVEDVIGIGAKITAEDQLVSGKLYLLRNTATGNPWITDAVTYYSVANGGGTFDEYCIYYLIKDGENTWKIKNYKTGKYWGKPTAASTTNQGGFVPTDEAGAGSWTLNFNSNGNIDPQCNGYFINRSSEKMHGWTSSLSSQIYEVNTTYPPFSEFEDKDIRVSSDAAASLQTNQWYVMFDRGAGHGYLYENNSNQLYNTATAPSGSATSNAKYLVRIVGWNNDYYLQTGLGNFFGNIQQSTTVPTTATATERITIKKISNTDGHFYLMSAAGIVLDANAVTNGDANVVGWGNTAPTSTGGNNDWAFYPVEFVESQDQIAAVYTINNTNTNRGALTYEPSKSTTYVWSSGKSGATAFDASNPNHQWVIIPTGTAEQYYLYNVGANKFAIPSGIAQGANIPWVFSDNAVAVIFETQGDGTKKIKMASTPVSGTNAAYMAVSNNYTGPIINYNDVGGNFTITKVENVTAQTQAEAAVAKLVKSQTALTEAVTATDGWYVIQIKTTSNSTATASPGRYIYPGANNQANYPLTFTGGVDVQPAISDATFYTRFVKNGNDYNWQMTNGQYLINRSNVFPTSSSEPMAVVPGYDNGNYIKSNGRFADPYVSSGNFFIGETSSYRTTWNIYPIDLTAADLAAWQVLCDNAPETAQISCTRNDVSGLTTVYKNGYIFLPATVTPESSDFVLDGAIDASVDADAKTITLNYNPDLAIVEGGVTVAQGWQTASRGEEVMLLKVDAAPFRDATEVSISINLKDGSEANISKLTLYEASSNSPEILSSGNAGAPTKTAVAEVSVSGATASLAIGNLSAGNHYYWIGATVKDDAQLGAILDVAVTGLTYTCNSNVTNLDLTSVGDPADRGAMVFNVHSYPFLPRDNGSRVYRIPAMIVADDGTIVVACDKRYDSYTDIGNGHVIDIVVRRSTDGGKTWSEPVTIAKGLGSADNDKCGYGDPSLVKGKDGKIYCLFVAGNIGYFYGQKRIAMSTSSDNGVTWSSNESTPPVDLLESGRLQNYDTVGDAGFGLYDYFVTSGRGLYIPEDDILMYLIPAQTMTSATEHTGNSQDYIFYSTDGGEKWYFSQQTMFAGGDEAKIIQMNDGSLLGSIRQGGNRGFNTATYMMNDDGTLDFTFGSQWNNPQLNAGGYANNQDIFYYQRETASGKKDVIIHSMTTGQHANLKLYYSTDKGQNWIEFLTVQTKGTRYVTMDKSGTDKNPGSLYLFFEDQSLNSAGGYTDYNHYPLNFLEITREQLLQYIPDLDKSALENEVKIVAGMAGEETYGAWANNKTTWTSNASSGVSGLTLTKDGGTFDKFSNWNSHYNLAFKPAAANAASTLTLTAPEGYIIRGYSMLAAKSSSAAHTYTLTAGDGTSVEPAYASSASGYTTFSIDDINATSTTISVTTTDLSKYIAIADFSVTLVKLVSITLDETADMAATIEANDGKFASVTLNRSIVEGFNSVVLPFDLSAAQVQTLFGTGAKVYAFSEDSDDADNVTVKFNTIAEGIISANQPVLVDATAASTQNSISLVNVEYAEEALTAGKNVDFVGIYAPAMVPEGDYFIAKGAIYKSEGTTSIKSFRAFLKAKAPVAGIKLYIDDIEDGIQTLSDTNENSESIYNVAGQRLSKTQKGINIVNGKKLLK